METRENIYRSTVTDLGENVAKVDARLEDEQIVFKQLKEQREAVSGVNLDEEAVSLIKYERAFQGASRFVRVVDDLIAELVALIR